MTPGDHEDYAADLGASLEGGGPEIEVRTFDADPRREGNAADAMAAILCHRLFRNSGLRPNPRKREDFTSGNSERSSAGIFQIEITLGSV